MKSNIGQMEISGHNNRTAVDQHGQKLYGESSREEWRRTTTFLFWGSGLEDSLFVFGSMHSYPVPGFLELGM